MVRDGDVIYNYTYVFMHVCPKTPWLIPLAMASNASSLAETSGEHGTDSGTLPAMVVQGHPGYLLVNLDFLLGFGPFPWKSSSFGRILNLFPRISRSFIADLRST